MSVIGKILRVHSRSHAGPTCSGLVVVPYERAGDIGYNCVIVKGNYVYPVGGHNIHLLTVDLERAEEVGLKDVDYGLGG